MGGAYAMKRQFFGHETGDDLFFTVTLEDAFLGSQRGLRLYGKPTFIRSDNGAGFTAAKVMQLAARCCDRSGLHRARQSVAKQVRRELQRQVA